MLGKGQVLLRPPLEPHVTWDYMTVYKQGATGQSADKAQEGVKSHRRVLSIRASGAAPRERIDVNQIVANTQNASRRYGSDPIRTELDPVRRMLDDMAVMAPDLV